jgi:hypothetical protein
VRVFEFGVVFAFADAFLEFADAFAHALGELR